MWMDEYIDNNGELYRCLDRENDDIQPEEVKKYKIGFDYEAQRYHCYICAINEDEALGIFLRNHETVKYQDIAFYYLDN